MKIIHASGAEYDLNPDTKIELTRLNPFFSNIGEQSLPVSLPASPRNLAILKNPHLSDNREKIPSRTDARIESGIFSLPARQAILSAKQNSSIQTSFYVRNGAFYEKTKDVSLMDIFKNKRIDFPNVDTAITFVRSLITTNDARFACFQVATENYIINKFGNLKPDGFASLVNEAETTEVIDDKTITVPKGFYISPFIRVRHVLEEALSFLGYTLAPSFLDLEPFSGMVFLNDTLDTIAAGSIRYIDIVPNIMLSTLFEVLRKFNVEPIPDDKLKTVQFVSFDSTVNLPVQSDLTSSVHNEFTVNYHHDYKQLKLSSEHGTLPKIVKPFSLKSTYGTISFVDTVQTQLTFIEVMSKYPGASVDKTSGNIYATAFSGESMFQKKVGSLSVDYYAGGILAVAEKKFPDLVPEIITQSKSFVGGTTTAEIYPYVGTGRFLQSTIKFSDQSFANTESENELRPMLCLVYRDTEKKYDVGTLSNYNAKGQRIYNYSLFFNGEDGIFEKFWRQYDTMLRNAFLKIDSELLLSEKDKFNLSALRKISINNQEYLINELKYVPEDNHVQPCSFLSVRLQHPISSAKTEADYFVAQKYKWIFKSHRNFTISFNPHGDGSPSIKYKSEPATIFPPPPTEIQYNAGGRYFETKYEVEYGIQYPRAPWFEKQGDGIITVWLEASLT